MPPLDGQIINQICNIKRVDEIPVIPFEKALEQMKIEWINKDADAMWEGKVFVVEKLGSGTFLYLEKNGEMLVVQTDGDSKIKVGDNVKIGFDATRCHIFDKSNKAFK